MEIKKLSVQDYDKYNLYIKRFIYESNNHCKYMKDYSMEEAERKALEMRDYICRIKTLVYGAVEDDKLIGFVWSDEIPFREDTNRLYISIEYVDAEYRNRDIESQLYRALEKEAIERGYNALFLHTEACNEDALLFYYREGFVKERIQLVKYLDNMDKILNMDLDARADYINEHLDVFATLFLENERAHILLDSFTYEDAVKKMKQMASYVSENKAKVYYIASEDIPIAMLWTHPYILYDEERIHISAIVVDSKYRGKGIAGQLYKMMYYDMKERGKNIVYTNVDAINLNSLFFHHKQGFLDEKYQLVKILNV